MSANALLNRRLRYFTALMAALTALIYFMIGFNVVSVLDTTTLAETDQTFGLYAGVAYALGAVLLVAFEGRLLWILGALLQVFVIYTYFALAPMRGPTYEVWGIMLRVAQVLTFITLTYLSLHGQPTQTADLTKRRV